MNNSELENILNNESYLGYIKASFIFEHSPLNRAYIFNQLKSYEAYIVRVVKDPWLLETSSDLVSIEDVPKIIADSIYTIEYCIDEIYFSINFSRQYIEFNLSYRPWVNINQLLYILQNFYSHSIIVVIGFEVEIFIDDLKESLTRLIQDRSLYPIYIKSYDFKEGVDFKGFRKLSVTSQGIPEKKIEELINMIAT
jgi:hypothetical protein